MAIQVREAREGDFTAFAAMVGEVQSLHRDWAPERYKAGVDQGALLRLFAGALDGSRGRLLIGEHEGAPAGYARLLIEARGETPFSRSLKIGVVDQIAVLAAHRRRGVGGALLAAARDLFSEAGADAMEASIWAENEASRALFSGLGFRDIRVRVAAHLDPGNGTAQSPRE